MGPGPPEPSVFNNPLAVTFMSIMLLLLIIIGILANILIGAADFKLKKRKTTDKGRSATAVLFILFMLVSPSLFAQDATAAATPTKAASTIGGMAASTFYVMVTILFLELLVIIALLINIKLLLRTEKAKIESAIKTEEIIDGEKASRLSWWDRFNKLRPVSQEADLDLGHDYDGIRELNNRLPPWWIYGFYATILFAAIYLWRFHVSHKGPSSKQEYERSVAGLRSK
jgi:cytochrome c oxidase cbb3-type subunit 3